MNVNERVDFSPLLHWDCQAGLALVDWLYIVRDTLLAFNYPLQLASNPMSEPSNEQAVLNYLEWQDSYAKEKPFQLFSVVPNSGLAGERTTNLVFKEGQMEFIRDVRGEESLYSLDTKGFAFTVYPTCLPDFTIRENIENVYLSEMEELLKREVDSVDKIYFFDWRVCSLIKTSIK